LPLFYDIHTHHHNTNHEVLAIQNVAANFASTTEICSIGLHPWHLQHADVLWNELVVAAQLQNVKAIGECGLDKTCETDWDLQRHYFQQQILLANQIGKPIIIHCVRAYSETLKMLEAATVPVIFHGYNRNEKLALQILDRGYYLSFGASILKEPSSTVIVLKTIPEEYFLLETDNAKDINIELIYAATAHIRQQSLQNIQDQIKQNYTKTFLQ
jgi:TatD DNase family protein